MLAGVGSCSFLAWATLGVLPLAAEAQPAPVAAPRIVLATNAYEFGRVTVGTVVQAKFAFTNVGGAPLEIVDLQPGCGCTTAGAWDRRVEPGETGNIRLDLETATFGGFISKTTTVVCNDPAQPEFFLTVRGEVWRPVEVQPAVLVFSRRLGSSTPEPRVVRVINQTDRAIEVQDLKSSEPAFRAALRTVRPGVEYAIEVALAVAPAVGTTYGTITASTTCSNQPVIQVAAVAIVQPPVLVVPSSILLSAGPLSAPARRSLRIYSEESARLSLSEPSIAPSNVVMGLSEVQAGRVFRVDLDFPAGFQLSGGVTGLFSVKTSHPEVPVLTVPILHVAASASTSSSAQNAAAPETPR